MSEEPVKVPSRASRSVVLGIAVATAFIGPALTRQKDHAAGAPFVFVPPEGFKETTPDPAKTKQGDAPAHVWILEEPGPYVPRVTVSHTDRKAPMDAPQVAEIAHGMPEIFRQSGITFHEARHESHVRPDGALIGLLYGDCVKDSDSVAFRSLQIAVPDDTGTSIVTASYSNADAEKLEPAFLAAMEHATGVAVRLPAQPTWLYCAWGGGGLVLAYLVLSVRGRRHAS